MAPVILILALVVGVAGCTTDGSAPDALNLPFPAIDNPQTSTNGIGLRPITNLLHRSL
jgi:hypothetical protein